MNDETTLSLALRIAAAINNDRGPDPEPVPPNPWVVVRGDRSGVFFGRLAHRDGTEIELHDCRHVWYWAGAASTVELSEKGVSRPDDCKIPAPVKRLLVLDAIEVLFCSDEAVESLLAVPVWSAR